LPLPPQPFFPGLVPAFIEWFYPFSPLSCIQRDTTSSTTVSKTPSSYGCFSFPLLVLRQIHRSSGLRHALGIPTFFLSTSDGKGFPFFPVSSIDLGYWRTPRLCRFAGVLLFACLTSRSGCIFFSIRWAHSSKCACSL